ncbi:MAG: 3-phosphoshikimate 1-carboxyvinyltransferase [Myxococcales bacterium]|nr:3-phosphoshikimate 1-carboxyvinyltransferase [Myxococcales bacterium]MDH5567096.1 3-phosphoshikimate 1-carboxyvinyltransferase [Myxococcales bacterium]
MSQAPDAVSIEPRGPLDARVQVPGSKSITNRALVAAALAQGESTLHGGLTSDDTRVMIESLRALGCSVQIDGEAWNVPGRGGRLRAPARPLDTGNSGTTARFLTAAAALADGPVVIDGNARMRERPIDDLVDALAGLGVHCEILGRNGCPPVRVPGGGLPGGRATIDARRSSQYVSAVLLAAPFARRDVTLALAGGALVSRPYVELTLKVMEDFGAHTEWRDPAQLRVFTGHPYRGRTYRVEPDASSAAYPFCAAAIAGGRVRVENVPRHSLQADFLLLDILRLMGCQVHREANAAEVTGPSGALRGVDIDMNDLPDATLALAVVALFAEGRTHIRNVANLRIKETDRLAALETELRKLGANAHADADSLVIEPGPLRGAAIDTYDDHRMAMAFALAGLRVPGVVIRDPGCVSKTWPDYFSMLEQL